MAKAKKTGSGSGPAVGDVFLMPLADGRFGVCRVLRDKGQGSKRDILVTASPWIGVERPALSDPRLREILMQNRFSFPNTPVTAWVLDKEPPDRFQHLGVLTPTAEELQAESDAFMAWNTFAMCVLLEWRWNHDRERLIEEVRRKEEQRQHLRQREQEERRRYLAGLTLEQLRTKTWLPSWKRYPRRRLKAACRAILSETVAALIFLGDAATTRQKMRVLKRCIERLNRLDTENSHFIETVEREDLCEAFTEIVHACGLGKYQDLADRWREW